MSRFPSEKSYTYVVMRPSLRNRRRAVYARCHQPDGGPTMAHAKDKGAKDKHVKKKASKGIKEKRAEKRLKHDTRRQTGAVETLSDR